MNTEVILQKTPALWQSSNWHTSSQENHPGDFRPQTSRQMLLVPSRRFGKQRIVSSIFVSKQLCLQAGSQEVSLPYEHSSCDPVQYEADTWNALCNEFRKGQTYRWFHFLYRLDRGPRDRAQCSISGVVGVYCPF